MATAYIVAPRDAARDIARTLVEDRLAACINIYGCESVYRWEGEIQEEREVILLAKTTEDGYDELESRVYDLHPYEVPCIERFDETSVLPAFGEWRDGVVDPPSPR